MKNVDQTKTILLVEDDRDLRKVIAEYLEGLGFHVIIAARGRCASRMLDKAVPDLALVDVSLPDMNGLEIIRWVKSEQHLNDIPIIIISGQTDLKDRLAGYLTGAERYLCKPFDLDELAEAINTLRKPGGDEFTNPEYEKRRESNG